MTEQEFIESIDPCLSFNTDQEYEDTASVGCSISDNAALMVGYLLASGSSRGSPDLNLHLLEILKRERPTPVVLSAIPVIESIMKNQPAIQESILRLLAACKDHPNAWNGLGIVECADESLREECEKVRSSWKRKINS